MDGGDLAKALHDAATSAHGDAGGWTLYTHIETEKCESCYFGFSSRWSSIKQSPWREYKKGGIDGMGTFETRYEAYREAKKACAEHFAEFNKN